MQNGFTITFLMERRLLRIDYLVDYLVDVTTFA